jgi:hypothetical protein
MNQTEKLELDQELEQLALMAQQYPRLSLERQQNLTRLVNGILRSGRLCRPQHGRFFGIYEEIYAEACQNLFLYICQSIEKYDPKRSSVMAWCNVLLDRRFFKEAIPIVLDQPCLERVSQYTLDHLSISVEAPTLTELLQECIESDPANCFQQEHIRDHPEVNFQALAIRRIAGRRWREISAEFGISIPTLAGFYQQNVVKFSDTFKKYCSEHGT